MKFGKIDVKEEPNRLNEISWKLPQASVEWNANLENSGIEKRAPNTQPLVRTGGTMWTVRSWRGKVYPQKDPMRTWAKHYGRQFSSLEFNATHYRIYPPEKMSLWAKEMPEDFVFCPKFPALISHYRRFNNCEGPTDDFISGLVALGDKLGPTFLQLPPHFAPKHSGKLIPYLNNWPRDLKMAIEFRHADWFAGGREAELVWKLMAQLGIGAVISDTAGRRDALHMRFTAPFLIVRFGGYDGHVSDEKRLRLWAEKINDFNKDGVYLESFDFLVHTTDSIHTPESCILFANIIKEVCGIDVKVPALIS